MHPRFAVPHGSEELTGRKGLQFKFTVFENGACVEIGVDRGLGMVMDVIRGEERVSASVGRWGITGSDGAC